MWTDLVGLSSDLVSYTFTVTSAVQSGSVYRFRYRAKNIHGWGPFSDNLILYAAKVPDTVTSVTVTHEGTFVKITWSLPASNGGLPILGYRVLIEEQDGDYSETVLHCDGSDMTIRANRYCLIPMSILVSPPYNLPLLDTIYATVEAFNLVGYSTPSALNAPGAVILTEPLSPPGAPYRVDSGTTDTRIQVNFDNLVSPNNGGSTIISLNLEWDRGTNTWTSLIGGTYNSLITTFTVTGLTPGSYYKFRYRASNLFGWGSYSAESTI